MNIICSYCAEVIPKEASICPLCGQYVKYNYNKPGYVIMSDISEKIKQLKVELADLEGKPTDNIKSTITTGNRNQNRIVILKKQIEDMEIEKAAFIKTTRPTMSEENNLEKLRKCPYCYELIKPKAIICRFCHRDISRENIIKELNYYYSLPEYLGWPQYDFDAPIEIRNMIPDNNDHKLEFINNYKIDNNKGYRYYTLRGLLLKKHLYSFLFKIDAKEGKPEPFEPLFGDYRSKMMNEEYLISNEINDITHIKKWNFTSLCDIAATFAEQMIIDSNKLGYKIGEPCIKAVNLLKKRSQLIKKYYKIIGWACPMTNLNFYELLIKDEAFNKEEYEKTIVNDENIREELYKLPPYRGFERYIYSASELCLHLSEDYLNDILENYRVYYTWHHLKNKPLIQKEEASKEFIELQFKAASIQEEYVMSIIK